jgi:hypothetical protein
MAVAMLKNFCFLLIGLIIFTCPKLSSQTFGFGCLGFVGGYGGFTYQQYDAKGLNEAIRFWNSLEFLHEPMEEFTFATGYRVGLNFFRATFENNIILTAKGYYQSLDKTNKAKLGDNNSDDFYTLDMDMRNWAIGFDVGWELTKASIGTGIIVAIIKDYISIEGLAGYTYLSIDNVYNDMGTPFLNPIEPNDQFSGIDGKFIESGGFTAVVQINIGFPIL